MACLNRKFGYVDFASEDDMNKALELNGKKVMGQEVRLDKARSKDNAQEDKKGGRPHPKLQLSVKSKICLFLQPVLTLNCVPQRETRGRSL